MLEKNNSVSPTDETTETIDLMQKIKGGLEAVNKNMIASNSSTKSLETKFTDLESEMSKIQETNLKFTTNFQNISKTLKIIGDKLVEGVNYLESNSKTNTKQIKNHIHTTQDKFIENFSISIRTKKISASIFFKVIFILLLINNLLLLVVILSK